MTAAIEAQIERFAPGFRDLILARHVMGPADLERHNANYVGGDIGGGSHGGLQLWPGPVLALDPYRTADRRPASTSARRRPRPAAASTACAATGRPSRP